MYMILLFVVVTYLKFTCNVCLLAVQTKSFTPCQHPGGNINEDEDDKRSQRGYKGRHMCLTLIDLPVPEIDRWIRCEFFCHISFYFLKQLVQVDLIFDF